MITLVYSEHEFVITEHLVFTCDSQSVVINKALPTIVILTRRIHPASLRNLGLGCQQLGCNVSETIIKFGVYDPLGPSTFNIYKSISYHKYLMYLFTIVKEESVISHSALPHWSAVPVLIYFLVNTHECRLNLSSSSCAGYSQIARVVWFSFCNI